MSIPDASDRELVPPFTELLRTPVHGFSSPSSSARRGGAGRFVVPCGPSVSSLTTEGGVMSFADLIAFIMELANQLPADAQEAIAQIIEILQGLM